MNSVFTLTEINYSLHLGTCNLVKSIIIFCSHHGLGHLAYSEFEKNRSEITSPFRDVIGFNDQGPGELKGPCRHRTTEHKRNVDVGYNHVPKRIRTCDRSVRAVQNRKNLNRATSDDTSGNLQTAYEGFSCA